MSRSAGSTFVPLANERVEPLDSHRILSDLHLDAPPFSAHDITAGTENELQAAVVGSSDHVDLPLSLQSSNYFKNVLKSAAAGERPRHVVTKLEDYIRRRSSDVWENSWVRLPVASLTPYAEQLLQRDFAADKSDPHGAVRQDMSRFVYSQQGEDWLRVPVSYLLKLSLAQAISDDPTLPSCLIESGEAYLRHFLNDNSSPETFSLYVVPMSPGDGMGRSVAKEMAQRFLLTQLLVMYANKRFGLESTGQRVLVYFAPHPPIRQKQLNTLISDSFYRELFMNPCLSGWDRGEEKHRYMHLCHEALSRSQLNAVIKLKDAGIITRNLVVLPCPSNISLANNGTHLSLGSRVLSELRRDGSPLFTDRHEKYVGDLVIKIVEHFLPLFVGTYSAAPYRLDFWDFHPERALGFLPHELEGMHLRMLWRRWKKKAGLAILGRPITPLGPVWLDKLMSAVLQLKGDCVSDFRLIDYLVALLGTNESPALDGSLGNENRLKGDLAQLGIFSESMSLYLLYKLRCYAAIGFSGFEGRHYSLFESFGSDMADAASLQALVTALAFKYISDGTVRHADIPDDPEAESERRQMIFGTAIGISACNVREDTPNAFLRNILTRTQKTRASRRYAGCLRVRLNDYHQALVATIEQDAASLIEEFGLYETIMHLKERLLNPEQCGVAGKITSGIVSEAGVRSPMRLSGDEFNRAAERYYRDTLRVRQLSEALDILEDDLKQIDSMERRVDQSDREMVTAVIGSVSGPEFLREVKHNLLKESADTRTLARCIALALVTISRDASTARAARETPITSV